jgi:hypothetical protein
MDKIQFKESIATIESNLRKQHKFAELLGMAFPNAFEANLLPPDEITYYLVDLLQDLMKDDNHWISWYIFDTDFGTHTNYISLDGKKKQAICDTDDLYELIVYGELKSKSSKDDLG